MESLIQRAKAQADRYSIQKAAEGYRVWKHTEAGWRVIGHLVSRQDAEELIVGKLSHEQIP